MAGRKPGFIPLQQPRQNSHKRQQELRFSGYFSELEYRATYF